MQSGICKKCRKRDKCKTPCAPVELHLREDNLTAFQKNGIGKHGEEIRIAMPRSREDQRSSLSVGAEDKAGDPRLSTKDQLAFSTENENPFMHYTPHKKQTSVFIKRFFGKWSYEDIAQAHDITPDAARSLYHAAAKRLLAVIVEMDAVKKAMAPEQRKKANVKKSQRYYEKNKEKVKAARRARYAAKKKAKK